MGSRQKNSRGKSRQNSYPRERAAFLSKHKLTRGIVIPEVSIIVRTFNEERHLERLLRGIRAQTYQDYEIINVDSGSWDKTGAIAARYCDKFVNIKSGDFTFGYSLNAGIRASEGRYLVCISAHTEPVDSSWLATLIAPLVDTKAAMVVGRQMGGSASKFSETTDLSLDYVTKRFFIDPPSYFANNANSGLRHDLWEQHPFDETLPGLEDLEWAKFWVERGYQIVYEPRAGVYHYHDEPWPQLGRRYYREAVAARSIGFKTRRRIPREIAREGKRLFIDVFRALRRRKLISKGPEIVLFRYHKTLGIVQGLWGTNVVAKPERREEMYFDPVCKGVVIHDVNRASLDQISTPLVKPGDVLIKVAYVGVCHTDLEIVNGTLGMYQRGRARYPIVPGHEFSGRLVKVGPNVAHLSVGDEVVAETVQGCEECEVCRRGLSSLCANRIEVGVCGQNGAYAEYLALPGRFVHRLPKGTDLKEAALCEPLSVIAKALRRLGTRLDTPRRCVVIGAGPLGHLCARVLAIRGQAVSAYDTSKERCLALREAGIEVLESLSQLSDFEVVIEATGNPEALEKVLNGAAIGSTILLLGLPYGKREFNFECIVADDKIVTGSVGAEGQDTEAAIDLIALLDLSALTQVVLPLERFAEAWEAAKSRKHLKILLEVDGLGAHHQTAPRAEVPELPNR